MRALWVASLLVAVCGAEDATARPAGDCATGGLADRCGAELDGDAAGLLAVSRTIRSRAARSAAAGDGGPDPAGGATPEPEPVRTSTFPAFAHGDSAVTGLPGLHPLAAWGVHMMSGYIDIGDGKQLFYWFVESESDPKNDPLFLWTNGGPGCSGLLGFMTEMGPFRPTSDGSLVKNPHRWTKEVSMLFIEQPAGVGFSAPASSQTFTDETSAADMWKFIQGFMAKYPDIASAKLPFWLTSESYGGHYIPALGKHILEHNQGEVDFTGMVIGNPLIYLPFTNFGMYGLWHSWAYLPDDLYQEHLRLRCYMLDDYMEPMEPMDDVPRCKELLHTFNNLVADIDPYGLGFPICASQQAKKVHQPSGVLSSIWSKLWAKWMYTPCSSDYATEYLNRDDVQKALHIKEHIDWAGCSDAVEYSQDSVNADIRPTILHIVNAGIRTMIMSGNRDSVCSSLGDQQWIWNTSLPVVKEWAPFKFKDQVGGFKVGFASKNASHAGKEMFRYSTVQGAGHMIPMTTPEVGAHVVLDFVGAGADRG